MKQMYKKYSDYFAGFLMVSGAALTMVLATVVAPVPAANAADCNTQELSVSSGVDCAKTDDQPENLEGQGGVIETVTTVLLFVIGAVSVIMLIIGGIRYTTSNGDQGAVTSAKNTIMYAIIGLIVALLSYALVSFVANQFSAE